jgi:hypothetical protein
MGGGSADAGLSGGRRREKDVCIVAIIEVILKISPWRAVSAAVELA